MKSRPRESNSAEIICFSMAMSVIQIQACLDSSEPGWLDLLLAAWPWPNPATSWASALPSVMRNWDSISICQTSVF